MFSLNNVKYRHILNIQELTIKEHKITCIVGQSGSGKSTLLRLLNKLISCDSGDILFNNVHVNMINSVELRRNVVMLPQLPVIYPGTIKENLLIGLKFVEKPFVDDTKLYQILKLVHLNKVLDDDCNQLSGGEKQRLALARVILLDPDVFLLDEPSSALDEETERIIIEKLVDLTKKKNKTLIMVTHSKKVAETYSEYIIEISQGKVIDIKEI
ncbi:ABC transporter ATP-binding protein [Anaeromicropila populeti]|uniref:Putative ABC transport system ATP-binding protein n=1 Tax=Anaeromicropila populeti TaxID=37658 RepID=A0A1I6K6K4_9FIRM|nr:ABC transporter ATP-binding protein [Anaeromicropila populeti]SFR86827.1 putative ABC transport system ATP-binding protein [Anaeromicropila populeti]